MHYRGNALPKRKSRHWLGVIGICIVILLAIIIEAWGHDTPRIRNGTQTHTLSKVWSDGDGHWHEDADGRGAGAWDQCVADAYNPETDSYNLPGGRCAEESTPPPPVTPPPPSEPDPPSRTETRSTQQPEPPTIEKKEAPEPEPQQQVEMEQSPTPTGFYEFNLELNAGWNLVHIPLELLAIDNQVVANETIGELFYALGIDTMYYHDGKCWIQVDENTAVIRKIYQGFVIYAESPISRTLLGLPLQGNLLLQEGMNIVGIPRHSSNLKRVSDLLSFYPEICAILVEDEGTLQVVGRVGDPGDIPITGGQAFGIISTRTYFTTFEGEPWGTEIYE